MTQPDGGPAVPVQITMDPAAGGPAIPVYGYSTMPTDRKVLGGPALRVKVLTAADLVQNGGQYRLEGRPTALPVYTAPAGTPVAGGPVLAVYPVNGAVWPEPDDPVVYLLEDEFTTNRAAGAVNGTAAEPGPGTRTVVDTGSALALTGGEAVMSGWTAVGNPGLWYGSFARTQGRVLLFTVRNTAGLRQQYGWDTNQSGSVVEDVLIFDSASGEALRVRDNNVQSAIFGALAANTVYHVAVVLLTNGAQFLIKGGAYQRWTLLWVATAGVTTPVFPSITINQSTGRLAADRVAIPDELWTATPAASDSFNRANGALGSTDGAGAGVTGGSGKSWTARLGTFAIVSNTARASALSGGAAIATVDAGTGDVTLDAALTWSSGNAGIVARWLDAANYLYAYHDGTNAVLKQVVGGVETTLLTAAKTYSAGAVLRLVLDGQVARLYYSTGASAQVGSVNDEVGIPGQLGTQHGLYSTNTANSIDNFTVWPRYGHEQLDEYGDFDVSGFAELGDSWIIARNLSDVEAPYAIDMDGNGLTDIIAVNSTGSVAVYWWKQGASAYQWTRYTIDAATAGNKLEGLAAGDFDGDGDIEVVVLDQTGGIIRLYKPAVAGTPTGTWTMAQIKTDRPNLQDVKAWDLDGDGVPEILYSYEGSTAANGGLRWLKLTGADPLEPTDWTEYTIVTHPGAWRILKTRLNLSGGASSDDIVFTARKAGGGANSFAVPGIYWVAKPADPTTAWPKTTIESRNLDWLNVDVGDFFGDGHSNDLVACEKGGAFGLVCYRQSAGWAPTTLSRPNAEEVYNVSTIPDRRFGPDRDAFMALIEDSDIYIYRWTGLAWEYSALGYTTQGHPADNNIYWITLPGIARQVAILADSDTTDPALVWIDPVERP